MEVWRPMSAATFENAILRPLRILIEAEDWNEHVNAAYLRLFAVDVSRHTNTAIHAARLSVERLQILALFTCLLK